MPWLEVALLLSSGVVASAGATGTSALNPWAPISISQVTMTKVEVRTGMPIGSRKIATEAQSQVVTTTPKSV